MKTRHIATMLLAFSMNAVFANEDIITVIIPGAELVMVQGADDLGLTELEKRRLQRALNVCHKYYWDGEWELAKELRRLKDAADETNDLAIVKKLKTFIVVGAQYVIERVAPYHDDCAPYKLDHATMTISRVEPEDLLVDGKEGFPRNVFIPAQIYEALKGLAGKVLTDEERPSEYDLYVAEVRRLIESGGSINAFVIP